jgi:hypothetical protein
MRMLVVAVLLEVGRAIAEGTTLIKQFYWQLHQGKQMRFRVIAEEPEPDCLRSEVIRWENEFYAIHGRMPEYQDYLDRIWSLEFLAQHGRPPTEQEWKEHYYESGGSSGWALDS